MSEKVRCPRCKRRDKRDGFRFCDKCVEAVCRLIGENYEEEKVEPTKPLTREEEWKTQLWMRIEEEDR